MTENEAIKELKENTELPFGSDVSHEASKLAIKAIEEIQQYRSIGTVDDFERLVYLKERYENETYDYCGEYGTEECPRAKEIQQYQAIGTVDECREARERQRAKKPIEYEDKYYACPVCNNVLMRKWEKYPSQLKDKKCGLPYCLSCGQAIDWSDVD